MARDLDRRVAGSRIVDVTVTRADVLREVSARALRKRTAGAVIRRCWRRAKLVVMELSTGDRIAVQPRFTGALLLDDGSLPDAERRYSTLALWLEDGRRLHYRDIRRLGTVALMGPERWAKYSSALGIEPLDRAFSPSHLSGVFRGSRQAVKKVLMDQRRIAGVGNIYANEALWRAGIDPSRAARTLVPEETEALHRAVVDVLREAVEARGTSVRDYRDASGAPGQFVSRLNVYGRGGLPCVRCGARLIATHVIDGRQSVLCARCQK
jgi:formamidopyrimidine-DNA glycosylase